MNSTLNTHHSQRRLKARNRVDKACDHCRRRKEKCNGSRPKCSNCAIAGRQCQYATEIKRRGLQEGWVHALEKTLALAISDRPEVERELIAILEHGVQNPHDGDFAALWTDEANEAGLFRTWRSSLLRRELENLLPSLEHLQRCKITSAAPETSKVASLRANQPNSRPPAEVTRPPPTLTQTTELPADALTMVDAYFRTTHTWFPVLQKHQIYRACYTWSRTNNEADGGARSCLVAVIALQKAIQAQGDAKDFLQHAETLVADAVSISSSQNLGYIQALLMLSICHLVSDASGGAWLLVGQATRMALLTNTTAATLAQTSIETGASSMDVLHRTLLGCMVLDVMTSAAVGQQPSFPAAMLATIGPISVEGIEEWEPLDAGLGASSTSSPGLVLSTFNGLVEACRPLLEPLTHTHSGTSARSYELAGSTLRRYVTQDSGDFAEPTDVAQIPGTLPHQRSVTILRLAIKLLSVLRSNNAIAEECVAILRRMTDLIHQDQAAHHSVNTIHVLWRVVLACLLREVEKGDSESQPLAGAAQMTVILGELVLFLKNSFAVQTDPEMHETGEVARSQTGNMPVDQQDTLRLTSVLNTIDRAVSKATSRAEPSNLDKLPAADNISWLDSIGDDSSHLRLVDDLITMDATDWSTSWEQSFQGLGFPMDSYGHSDIDFEFPVT